MSEGCKVDDRCLIAAHICGDEFAIDFWTVASYYLNKMKREKWRHVKTPTSDRKGNEMVLIKIIHKLLLFAFLATMINMTIGPL